MNKLQGRLPEIEPRKDVLISALTFERLARLIRYLTLPNGEIGINAQGGLELTVNATSGGGGGGEYGGPFAVSYDNGTITIKTGNIIAGTSTINVAQSTKTGTGMVYLSLAYSSNNGYSYTIGNGPPPPQSASTAIYRLAQVASDGTVTQYQYGDIYVSGRIVA